MNLKKLINQNILVLLLWVTSIILVFWQYFSILIDDVLKNEMATYILALPFLITYMLYRERETIKAWHEFETEKKGSISKDIVGASLCVSSMFIYGYGSFNFNTLMYHSMALLVFILGGSILIFGIQNMRNMALPLISLLLLIIPYREEAYQISAELSVLTTNVTYNLLKVLGFPVSLSSLYESPSIILETSSGQIPFVIDIACAGAYSLLGFLVFAFFFAYISQGSRIKKIVWLLIGFCFIYLMNIFRVSLILAIGYWWGVEAAMGLFHTFSGSLLIFGASFIMILVGEKIFRMGILKTNTRNKTEPCFVCKKNASGTNSFCGFCGRFLGKKFSLKKMDIIKVLSIALIIGVILNFQLPSLASAQKRIMATDIHDLSQGENQTLIPNLDDYDPTFLYRDQKFEIMTQQDASLLFIYNTENRSKAPIFVSIEIADSHSKLHRWEVCLYIASPEPSVNPISSKDITIFQNPPFNGRLFVYQYTRSEQTVMILYWYQKVAIKIGDTWTTRYLKTSLIAYLDSFVRTGEINNVEQNESIENILMTIAQNIIEYWEPVKTWSGIIVAFSEWGQTLAISTFLISLVFPKTFSLFMRRGKDSQTQSRYKQLVWHSTFSRKEKLLLETLDILGKQGTMTTIELAKLIQQKTAEKFNTETFLEILDQAEKNGFIQKTMENRDSKPMLVWKVTTTFQGP